MKRFVRPLLERTLLICFGCLLTFVLTECALRVAGDYLYKRQRATTMSRRERSGVPIIRILTLGESTTASNGRDGWPEQLESILNESLPGVRFIVINEALPATNTTFILANLPSYLQQFQPHIVITMMGINDILAGYMFDGPSDPGAGFVANLKTLKVLRWMARAAKHVYSRNSSQSDFTPGACPDPSWNSDRETPEVMHLYDEAFAAIAAKRYDDAERIAKEILAKDPASRAGYRVLMHVAYYYRDTELAAQYAMKSIDLRPCGSDVITVTSLVQFLHELGRDPRAITDYLGSLGLPLRENRRENSLIATIYHYRTMYALIRAAGARYVAMQYPRADIEQLKRIFPDEQADILFVANNENFESLVSKEGYDAVFTDQFGHNPASVFHGEFGHATRLGNSLIAQNVSHALLERFGDEWHALAATAQSGPGKSKETP